MEIDEKGRKYGIEILGECSRCPHCPLGCWKEDENLKAKILHIRDVTVEEAKQYILDHLSENDRTVYTSELVEELGINLFTLLDACEELVVEGRLHYPNEG